jgi:hypothetical protein
VHVGPVVRRAIVGLVVCASACSRNACDPGNRRLADLRRDPAASLVPPGTSLQHTLFQPASTNSEAPGCDPIGPRIDRVLKVTGDDSQVEQYLLLKLPELGWRQRSSDGLTFLKPISGWSAELLIYYDKTHGTADLTFEAPPATAS